MAYRPKLKCPTLELLAEVERTFSVVWPDSFRRFCKAHASVSPGEKYPSLKGTFLCDLASFESTNVRVGEGTWGDYERAIAGKQHPKDGRQLTLGLLPFYVHADCVYGFLPENAGSDKVVVWSVHTLVHEYATFDDWLFEEGR